jgi:serine/threonine protein kinase
MRRSDVAELVLLGEYQGPGEQKTAERLAEELPASWTIFANRRLPGADRDDVDLLVLGEKRLFVVEEKAWGPRVVVDDNEWYVGTANHARMNPLNRVSQLARKIAGLLRDKVSGYNGLRGHHVLAAVVLSHDNLQLLAGPHHDDSERIYPLQVAAAALMKIDAEEGGGLYPVRAKVGGFLRGIPARPARPPSLGPYRVLAALDVPGTAVAYEGEAADGQRVVLKCYRRSVLEQLGDPENFLRRESAALNRLADSGRAWRVLPFFSAEDHTLFVVPLIPARERRHLQASWTTPDPERPEGVLPERVGRSVVTDAFTALAEVHEHGLVHRALHPRRVWLGKGLRVLFSDFHLARITGEQTVALWAPDGDISEDYRAPECAASVSLATASSDVFSLALSLASWLLALDASELSASERRTALEAQHPWAVELVEVTSANDESRPSAAELAEQFRAPTVPPQPDLVWPPEAVKIEVGNLVHGRYRVDRLLGSGGFAHTWLVYDEQIQAKKVLKAFHQELPEDAQREYASAHLLKHDRCARVYDLHVSESPHYLVAEYIDGSSLSELKPVTDVEALRTIGLGVLEGLEYIHGKQLVHGDVTPSNVIVGPSHEATLIDFGLAVLGGARPQGASLRFAAPELVDGVVSPASDVFGAAASILYSALGRDAVTPTGEGPRVVRPLTSSEIIQWGPEGVALLEALLLGVALAPGDRPSSARVFSELIRSARPVEVPPEASGWMVNPTVLSLRRLYRASEAGNAGNRGLDDDFAKETYVPTLLDTSLVPGVLSGDLSIVLLTGNPGDGKTSFLAKLGDRLRQEGAEVVEEDQAGWHLQLGGRNFRAVYDASESHGELSSDALVLRALQPAHQDPIVNSALIAVNDGRLRQFLIDHDEFEDLQFEVERQQKGAAAIDHVALVDLKRRSLAAHNSDSSLALRTLDSFTREENWSICQQCKAREVCPMRINAADLRTSAREAFHELVLVSHLRRRRRATFRDLRSASAYVITGDRSCETVHEFVQRQRDPRFLENALARDLAFDNESNDYLVQEWVDVDPGRIPAPGVDEERRSLDRGTLPGSPESLARAAFFMRRNGEVSAHDLRAFRYLEEFTRMTSGEDGRQARSRILLGMSRLVGAFGYAGQGLALSSNSAVSDWSVLRVVPQEAFAVEPPPASSPYVEGLPDSVLLKHVQSGRTFGLTLDTAEIILRAADGELVDDAGSDAIRQEIDGFVSQLSREPSSEALIIDSAGTVAVARVDGDTIALGTS